MQQWCMFRVFKIPRYSTVPYSSNGVGGSMISKGKFWPSMSAPLKRAFANLVTDHQVGMDKIPTLSGTLQIRQELAILISLMVVMVFLICIPWFWASRVISHVIPWIQQGSIIDNIAQSGIPNHFCPQIPFRALKPLKTSRITPKTRPATSGNIWLINLKRFHR